MTLRSNSFVANVVYVIFIVVLISICCLLFELDVSVVVICYFLERYEVNAYM
jgi:hypothetical protein